MAHVTETKAHPASIDEVITTVIMARVTDFFGFFAYAIASALVFPALFFPDLSQLHGTLASFGIFSLAFLARPFGALIARRIENRIGRIGRVATALMVLGTATVAIGLLPGTQALGGYAVWILAALRIGQGLGLGGAWDGLTLQLQYSAPPSRRGRYAMVPQLGGPIGFVIAAAMYYVLTGFLTEEEFLKWGWRFTFFAVFAVNVVSLFARIRLLHTDFGYDQDRHRATPIPELLQNQWRPILISASIPLASYALFHMITVFPLAYAMIYNNVPAHEILLVQCFGGSLGVLAVICSGVLSDRYGRWNLMMITSVLMAVTALILVWISADENVFIIVGFVVLGLTHGQAGAVSPSRFLERYRYSGTGLATNLSWIVGAAFAPIVALGLTAMLGAWAAALYLLSGVLVTLIALLVAKNEDNF